MKKLLIFMILILLSLSYVYKDKINVLQKHHFTTDAKAMIVIDAENGKILYEKNSKEKLPIASMSKMMTQYLVMNAIKNGTLSWESSYEPSEAVQQIAGLSGVAKLNMAVGRTYTVEELFTAATVNSSNDAAVALSEMVGGTEENFVTLMNEQAKSFGLKNTTFYNATGLDGDHLGKSIHETNTASARDIATIAQKLIEKHPEIFQFTQLTSFETSAGITLWNSNLMLQGMSQSFTGIDGLKTGYTYSAGSCFASTGVFNDRRIITVVMDVETSEDDVVTPRFSLTKELIEHVVLHE